jgi:threonine dehydrogenase-like Zn-dependent dehydrogenase
VIGISGRDGCFADLIAVPQRNCFRVPDSIGDEQAVFVEPLAAAIQVIKQVPVDAETKATVLGDGRLGLLVAQVLQSAGVTKLTLVGRHERKLALAGQRGIRTVESDAAIPNRSQDLVVECTGKPAGLAAALQFVRPRGVIVLKSTYAGPGAANLAPVVIDEVQVTRSTCWLASRWT